MEQFNQWPEPDQHLVLKLALGAAFAVTTLPGCLAGLAVARNYDVLPRGMIALGLLPWGILVVEATGLIAAISLTV